MLGIHDIVPPVEGGPAADAGADHELADATEHADATDGSQADGGADAHAQIDAQNQCIPVATPQSPLEGGVACAAEAGAGTCYPHDLSSWSPTWAPPVGAGSRGAAGLCSATQISDFYAECLGTSSTMAGCNTWIAANATCHGCLFTGLGASQYGAIIGGALTDYLNVGGCIAALEPCNTACGQAFDALFQCDLVSCDAYCSTQASGIACANGASNCSACEGFAAAALCIEQITGPKHPAYTPCLANVNGAYAAAYSSIALALCGN